MSYRTQYYESRGLALCKCMLMRFIHKQRDEVTRRSGQTKVKFSNLSENKRLRISEVLTIERFYSRLHVAISFMMYAFLFKSQSKRC